jgi:hypothetical protein
MNNYHYRANRQREIKAWGNWVDGIVAHCDYSVTLQSNLKTNNSPESLMEEKTADLTRNLEFFRRHLNQRLTGKRDPDDADIPIFFPVIEGSLDSYSKGKTLHIHAALGNLPATLAQEDIEALILEIWKSAMCGISDIQIDPFKDLTAIRKWSSYILKEIKRGNFEVVDLKNLQGPQRIVRAK